MAAAEAMRRILIDNARRKQTRKHGGDRPRQMKINRPAIPTVGLLPLTMIGSFIHAMNESVNGKPSIPWPIFWAGMAGLFIFIVGIVTLGQLIPRTHTFWGLRINRWRRRPSSMVAQLRFSDLIGTHTDPTARVFRLNKMNFRIRLSLPSP